MRKVSCIFYSNEDAERARHRLVSECGGDCRISNPEEKNGIFSDVPIYAIPSNFGVNIAPQTAAAGGSWQIIPPSVNDGEKENKEYELSYIGFEAQAKKAESLLVNLGGSHIRNKAYPI